MLEHAIFASPVSSIPKGAPTPSSAKKIYTSLFAGAACHEAEAFLSGQLDQARTLPCDLPEDPAELHAWAERNQQRVTETYAAYLAERKAGKSRRYFSSVAHALYFIRGVAPTKLVDGAWLYGCLAQWQENDFRPLIKTYVEELGEGAPAKNHVVLYQRLLDTHGVADWSELGEEHFTQGAIQLALAQTDRGALPEVVGYNLGYEQLPLHLLISSYELNELGIDPYYFTLHLTVDNASTGHAHDAIEAVLRLMQRAADPAEFYQRVRDGYRLNDLGASSTSVIQGFSLDAEVVRVLAAKARVGKHMHSDYCRVAGKSINDWLAEPAQIPALLREFERTGWITRGQAPANSRFWRLIEGERAEMFGVFSPYERQVMADWISSPAASGAPAPAPRIASFRSRTRALEQVPDRVAPTRSQRQIIRQIYDEEARQAMTGNDLLRALEQDVAQAPTRAAAIALLLPHLSPTRHHTAVGLMATRLFARMYA
ncbi:MAG: iron-containing redox enzyme family protein [Pseudomonadota bacterium]